MNGAFQTLVLRLKPLFERFFLLGMQITTEEAAAELAESGNAARKRGLKSTLETIDFANDLVDADESKREAIAIFKKATVEQTRMMQMLLNEPTTPDIAERALNRPFEGATPSPLDFEPKGLEHEANGVAQPVKRPRGRPKKVQPQDQ